MPSRVIHFRLDDESLLSVLEFYSDLSNNGQAPLSTRIASVLATLMKQLRDDGYVPTYQPNEVGIRLNAFLSQSTPGRSINLSRPQQLYIPGESPEPDSSGDSSDVEQAREVFEQLAAAEDPRARLRALIDEQVRAITEPQATLNTEIWAPDPEDLPDPEDFQLNISEQPKLTDEELAEVLSDYPNKATAIQEALVSKDSATILAHSIVLKLSPEDAWFTDHYFSTVAKVRKHIKESKDG